MLLSAACLLNVRASTSPQSTETSCCTSAEENPLKFKKFRRIAFTHGATGIMGLVGFRRRRKGPWREKEGGKALVCLLEPDGVG